MGPWSNSDHTARRALLRRLNWICAVTHGILTAVTLSIGNMSLAAVLFTSDVQVNPQLAPFLDTGNASSDTLRVRSFLVPDPHPNYSIPLVAISALFPALSCAFHIGHAGLWEDAYAEWVLRRCCCPTRWVEYFFSAPLMVFCLSLLSAQLQLAPMLMIATLIGVTMTYGWMTEVVARPNMSDVACASWSRPRNLILAVHALGWIPQLAGWAFMAQPLIASIGVEQGGPPAFVVALACWSRSASLQ